MVDATWIAARQAAARKGVPMTVDEVKLSIARFERGKTSKAALRKAGMAAIERGNLTEEARQFWRDYLQR